MLTHSIHGYCSWSVTFGMMNPASILDDLLAVMPQLRPQIYFKSSLTALSHAMEDQVLAGDDQPVVIASFQRERFYRQEAHRYLRIADRTPQVYVLAAPEADFANASQVYETIAFQPGDGLSEEWHLVVLGHSYAACLICKEKRVEPQPSELHVDQSRRFEGLWTFDRAVVFQAAELLLQRVVQYRPELAPKVVAGLAQIQAIDLATANRVDPGPFTERLVTYLQAGQYKLSKAYRAIASKERQERLVNLISSAVRRSLKPDEVLQVAAQELGKALQASRCLIYRCAVTDATVTLQHEYLAPPARKTTATPPRSLVGQVWTLTDNPLFQAAIATLEPVYVEDTARSTLLEAIPAFVPAVASRAIGAWLMLPLVHQDHLLGMVELHFDVAHPQLVANRELELVQAVAVQVGMALIQAEAYANLEDLNQQLEVLDRTRSNLIAITGHELRTPLSTIQICLESLATDPEMPVEMRQVMLNSALADSDRMRKLIQDFLTLSRLESGRVEWRMEPMLLLESVELALSSLRTRYGEDLPRITIDLPDSLPFVLVDGEWLVEALSKLLDNACKFTDAAGEIRIQAHRHNADQMLEVVVADTGRGIEPNLLETVFERFYQAEGYLRRSVGGTGLGLAICRQIIVNWGGRIWAESAGTGQGTQFHFTIPASPKVGDRSTARVPEAKAKKQKNPVGRKRRSAD
jgi:DICT domain-containing protein/GAF domain-containing protein